MKLVALSDTHWMYDEVEVPKCDILIHAGDLEIKNFKEGAMFGDWWNAIEADVKIAVPGNHDLLFERMPEIAKNYLDNTHILINESIVLANGLVISGSPYTLRFHKWAFMADESNIAQLHSCINPESDIIISHGPVYGIHDAVENEYAPEDRHVGSKSLLKLLESLDTTKERLFFQGHIHGNKNAIRHTKLNNIDIYNVSVSDDSYTVCHKPLVLEL